MNINDLSEDRRREIADTLYYISDNCFLTPEQNVDVFTALCIVCPELEQELYEEGVQYGLGPYDIPDEEMEALMRDGPAPEELEDIVVRGVATEEDKKRFEELKAERERKSRLIKFPKRNDQ